MSRMVSPLARRASILARKVPSWRDGATILSRRVTILAVPVTILGRRGIILAVPVAVLSRRASVLARIELGEGRMPSGTASPGAYLPLELFGRSSSCFWIRWAIPSPHCWPACMLSWVIAGVTEISFCPSGL